MINQLTKYIFNLLSPSFINLIKKKNIQLNQVSSFYERIRKLKTYKRNETFEKIPLTKINKIFNKKIVSNVLIRFFYIQISEYFEYKEDLLKDYASEVLNQTSLYARARNLHLDSKIIFDDGNISIFDLSLEADHLILQQFLNYFLNFEASLFARQI